MTELFSSPQRSLMLALLLLSCSVAGLMLTVQSITDVPSAQATADHSLPLSLPATEASAPISAVATLTLSNPVVTLDTDSKQLLAKLEVRYQQDGKVLNGMINIAGQPRLDETSKQFYLEQPVIKQLVLASVSADRQQEINTALTTELAGYFARQPVYAPMQSEALHPPKLEIALH